MPVLNDNDAKWLKDVRLLMIGRTITNVALMNSEDLKAFGWSARAFVFTLDNGVQFHASQDDEGNGPGAIFTTSPNTPCIPVMW